MATTTSCRTGCCYSVGDTLSASFKIKIITVTGCYQSSVFIQGSPQIGFCCIIRNGVSRWYVLILNSNEKSVEPLRKKIRKIVLNLELVT